MPAAPLLCFIFQSVIASSQPQTKYMKQEIRNKQLMIFKLGLILNSVEGFPLFWSIPVEYK